MITTTYIYDIDTRCVLRELKKPAIKILSAGDLKENEASVTDPPVNEKTDFEKPLIYDESGVIRNETEKDIEIHDKISKKRKKEKIISRNKQWQGHTIEGIIFSKALRKVIYNQLIRVQRGKKPQSVKAMKNQLIKEIRNWDEFDDNMLAKKHVTFKDEDQSEESIKKMKERAIAYQTDPLRFLSSQASCRALFDQIKLCESGAPVEDIEKVYGENFDKIIDEWTIDEESL